DILVKCSYNWFLSNLASLTDEPKIMTRQKKRTIYTVHAVPSKIANHLNKRSFVNVPCVIKSTVMPITFGGTSSNKATINNKMIPIRYDFFSCLKNHIKSIKIFIL